MTPDADDLALPTHCWSCGAFLMASATRHKRDCAVLAIIKESYPHLTDYPEEDAPQL